MKNRFVLVLAAIVACAGSLCGQTPKEPEGKQGFVYVLPDFVPIWRSYSLQDIRIDTGRINDRLVSCSDWTAVDPTPITGHRVLSFRLSSPNFGQGHFRGRRQLTSEGYVYYQTLSYMDAEGTCYADEYQITIVPTGPGQGGRWLPLAKFALYEVTKDGGVGDMVSCQIKRWCCLVNTPTCSIPVPCSLPMQADNLHAGMRDDYPFHWQDQFIYIEGLPSGLYWVEDEINPGFPNEEGELVPVMYESDYGNNSMFFLIELDQEAGTVRVLQPPKNPGECPTFGGCN